MCSRPGATRPRSTRTSPRRTWPNGAPPGRASGYPSAASSPTRYPPNPNSSPKAPMPKLLLLPGDGIGPEIIAEVKRVAERITNDLTVDERAFGGASLDANGVPLTDETLSAAKASDAVLMGAVGGAVGASPRETVPRNLRPEAGLLALRKGMEV